MTLRSTKSWTAIAGIASVVTTVVAIAVLLASGPPAAGDPPQQVAAFFADHHRAVSIALWIAAVSLGFDLAFYVLLGDLLRKQADATGLIALGVLGGAIFIAIIYAGFAVLAQLAYRAGSGDPATQRTLYDVYELSLTMTGVPTAVSVAAFSLVILRARLFPAWLGWYGGLVAAIHLLSSGAMARSGFFTPTNIGGTIAPIAFELWVLGISVLLLAGRQAAAEARSAATAGASAGG